VTTKSIVAAVVIAAGVVAVPLFLKATRATSSPGVQPAQAGPAPQSSRKTGNGVSSNTSSAALQVGTLPRFVDLGTTTCIPCKVMLGVMAELKLKYPGAFIVDFVNVKERPAEAERYGAQIIPLQIFYSPDGRELYRHTGVLRTEQVIAKWAELGFRFKPPAER